MQQKQKSYQISDQVQNRVKQDEFKKNNSQGQQGNQRKKKCNYCGEINHDFSKCKFKSYKCNNCGEIGHLKKVCKKPSNKNNTNFVEEEIDCDNNYISLYNIELSKVKSIPPVKINVKIDGVNIVMEVDSGAGISVIPFVIYKKYLSDKCNLNNCTRILKTYDNNSILPIGEINVQVEFKNKIVHSSIVIVNQNKQICLMGRDLMEKFGLSVNGINSLKME